MYARVVRHSPPGQTREEECEVSSSSPARPQVQEAGGRRQEAGGPRQEAGGGRREKEVLFL